MWGAIVGRFESHCNNERASRHRSLRNDQALPICVQFSAHARPRFPKLR